MDNLYSTIGQFTRDNLIVGPDIDILTKGIVLAKGQGVLKRGTVLGIVTTSGLAKVVDSTKTDGTQNANCILADTIDTGDGTATNDVKAAVYVSGLFNSNALTFGGTDTYTKHVDNLRMFGVYLKTNITY